jgi:hypothetical protein
MVRSTPRLASWRRSASDCRPSCKRAGRVDGSGEGEVMGARVGRVEGAAGEVSQPSDR